MHENGVPPAKILVIDDNQANRLLAQHTLEDEGYEIILAANGASGIEAFERHSPDCVLLDVKMPEMDGILTCERIRQLPRGPDTPVLFLTALRDVDTFDRALLAGGDDFLTEKIASVVAFLFTDDAQAINGCTVAVDDGFLQFKNIAPLSAG